jgi:indolepyruvate ferredoxin oxidoreductase
MSTAALPVASRAGVRLDDRYRLREGEVFMSGVQALVRVLLDQHRADAAAGARTGIFVSGYQGSPLGGFDREIASLHGIAEEHDIVHRPGVNEELGATAVYGSQLATTFPGAVVDGVLGVWYGKAPGVDRAADAIRHGNYVGADPRGGVLALFGDDPECKSSTLPSASESLLAALEVPVFNPGSVQELLDLGRHAIACSRASGLWAAMKVATAVADATATVGVGAARVTPTVPVLEDRGQPYVHHPSAQLLAPWSLEMERTLREVRLELAKRYARANGLNPVVLPGPDARLGVIAGGVAYHQLLLALAQLGLHDDHELRVMKIGLLYPLDEQAVREFAAGLDEVLVIEEKGPFLERFVKEALYGVGQPPLICGQRDDDGRTLIPGHGVLSADLIARALGERVLRRREVASARERLEQLARLDDRALEVSLGTRRVPYFCSGCPHSAGTKADDDALVGVGIGCHTMVLLNRNGRGNVTGLTQMGGEGAQWIGMAPFLPTRHYVQNLGDGTFHHSGSLAIRAALAAGLDVTYKLLYNDAVAMTGGQRVAGRLAVPELAASLIAEGVTQVVITTDDPARYHGVSLPAGASVRDRSAILPVQRELAQVRGVTVLIHDQACATELRRARRRGRAVEPPQRIVINERVCEGCGDCGEKSGCLSVEPVQTEFGRKTRIHQSSCNKDFSCLEGDCPSFLEVTAAEGAGPDRHPGIQMPDAELPAPAAIIPLAEARIRLVGIGGTGVVTISQVLGMAALIDGRHADGVDQTGLSQKAGLVSSDVRIADAAVAGGAAAPAGSVDLLLGFDLVATAATKHLATASSERTVAVVSTSVVPTARMVLDARESAPNTEAARAAIDAVTRAEQNFYLDAQALAAAVFGDHLYANVILLGAAWQLGAVPLSRAALRDAFTLNGTAVEHNLAAFEWGRAAVATPEHVSAVLAAPAADATRPLGGQSTAVGALAASERALVDSLITTDGELRRLLQIRVPDLLGWGGPRAAKRYVAELQRVLARERALAPGSTAVTEAVAIGLHKLIAYKDEYEVARLHLLGLDDLPAGAKVRFLLHPPLLRSLGLRRKLKFGRWLVPMFRLLAGARVLRGTPLDPFGRTEIRRVERALPAEYLALVWNALDRATLDTAREVADSADLIRGYEHVKLAGVERFRARTRELLA